MSEGKYSAVCRFCGQVITSDIMFDSEAEALDWGTQHCDCSKANASRNVESAQKSAREMLTEFKDKQLDIICHGIANVGFCFCDSATYKFDGVWTVKIKRAADGTIVVDLKKSQSERIEL